MKSLTSVVLLAIASFLLTGCQRCQFPYYFSPDAGTRSPKVIIDSPTAGEAIMGASFERFKVDPQLDCPPAVVIAPLAPPDSNGLIHFGAFLVKHGTDKDHVTLFWWSLKGKLRSRGLASTDHKPIVFRWLNERVINLQLGTDEKTIRLNEDDGPETTDL